MESLNLFVEGIREFIGHCSSDADLVSFWKNNQTQLDELKAALPDSFAEVVDLFKQAKSALKEKS